MRSKFILTVAASLLAGTIAVGRSRAAHRGEKDRTGQPTDSGQMSTQPNRQGGTQGQGGTVGGGAAQQGGPATRDTTPLQPGGISPSAPPQGADGGADSQPRPR